MRLLRRLLPTFMIGLLLIAVLPSHAASEKAPQHQRLHVSADPATLPAVPGARVTINVELPGEAEEELPLSIRLNGRKALENLAHTPDPVILPGETGTSFEIWTTGPFAGKVRVEVEVPVSARRSMGKGAATITFLPGGELSQVLLTRDEPLYLPVADPRGHFVAYLADADGVTVDKPGVALLAYADSPAVAVNGETTSSEQPLRIRSGVGGTVELTVTAPAEAGGEYALSIFLASDEDRLAGDTVSLRVVEQVPAQLSVRLYRYEAEYGDLIPAASARAGEDLFLQVGARDAYGSGIEGIEEDLRLIAGDRQIARGNPSGPADLISSEEFDSLDWWTYDEAVSHETWGEVLSQIAEPGDAFLYLAGGRVGVKSIGAAYPYSQEPLSAARSLRVTAGELAGLKVDDGESDPDDEIEVTGLGQIHGPYEIRLVDLMANQLFLPDSRTVTVEPGSESISFRADEGGPTVTTFSTESRVPFYFVATEAGVYEVSFRLEEEGITQIVTFVVE